MYPYEPHCVVVSEGALDVQSAHDVGWSVKMSRHAATLTHDPGGGEEGADGAGGGGESLGALVVGGRPKPNTVILLRSLAKPLWK